MCVCRRYPFRGQKNLLSFPQIRIAANVSSRSMLWQTGLCVCVPRKNFICDKWNGVSRPSLSTGDMLWTLVMACGQARYPWSWNFAFLGSLDMITRRTLPVRYAVGWTVMSGSHLKVQKLPLFYTWRGVMVPWKWLQTLPECRDPCVSNRCMSHWWVCLSRNFYMTPSHLQCRLRMRKVTLLMLLLSMLTILSPSMASARA